MLKKEIINKIKSISDHITNVDDIINYIFENEVKVEKPTYMAFRSAKLKEMVNNPITYKEKIAIISIEWKKLNK